MDGADLPEPSGPPESHDAVGFIIETLPRAEGIWLVPTGPLTNIALALRAAPDLAGRIAGISLMGGGTFGNRTAAAEFNIWCDPEAAAMVFSYGGPLIMCGPRPHPPVPGDCPSGSTGPCAARPPGRRARRPARLLQRHLHEPPPRHRRRRRCTTRAR